MTDLTESHAHLARVVEAWQTYQETDSQANWMEYRAFKIAMDEAKKFLEKR